MPQSGRFGTESTVESVYREAAHVALELPGGRFGLSRTDRGTDATRITSAFHRGVSRHEFDFGFTVVGGGAVDASTLAIGAPIAAGPTPTLWEGVEAAIGELKVYGPRSVHHCVDAEGLSIDVLIIEYEALRETADVLGVDIGDWENRQAWLDRNGDKSRSILTPGTELDRGRDASALLSSVALTLSQASFDVGPRRYISSKEIVARCSEYLDATGSWFPSIADLCRAAWTSERRLRQAFVDLFDRPPSQVLRIRALNAVHQSLRDGTYPDTMVTSVATSHGFRHFGDFARYYQTTYGRTPSETLRMAR